MKVFWQRTKSIGLGALCIVAALALSPLAFNVNYAYSTHDISPRWLVEFQTAFCMVGLGLVMMFVAPVVALILLLQSKIQQRKLGPRFFLVVMFWFANWTTFALSSHIQHNWPVRREGLVQSTERAKPLIGAIEKFKADKKRTPAALNELVPNYIASIPYTGMADYPEFFYRNDGGHDRLFKTYQLSVRTSSGFINFDRFDYWPEGDYPPQMYGGGVERIGAWAYVHE